MDKFWSVFWKLFGIGVAAAITAAIAVGTGSGAPDMTYGLIQKIIALALGICGVIGLVIVPVELYIEDRIEDKLRHGARA